jgi:hypothetical protein
MEPVIDSIAVALGLKKGAMISGFVGGLVSFLWWRELRLPERLMTALAGVPCGWYGGAALAGVMEWTETTEIGISFLVGAIGVSLLAAVVKAAPQIVKDLGARIRGGQ